MLEEKGLKAFPFPAMKKPLLTIILCLLGFSLLCQSYLDSVVTEEYYNSEQAEIDELEGYPSDHSSFRTYAKLNSPENHISAITGFLYNYQGPLVFGSTEGTVWNYEPTETYVGGEYLLSDSINHPLYNYDSFITLGITYHPESSDVGEILLQEVEEEYPSIYEYTEGENIAARIEVFSGLIGPNNYGVGPDLKVLLLQTTTDSQPLYRLNLIVGHDTEWGNEHYKWNTDLGIEKGLIYPVLNCSDPTACNYNDYEGYENNDIICEYQCYGCTDEQACNFSWYASIDDGSCDGLLGCTDESAFNYEPGATCGNVEEYCYNTNCEEFLTIDLCSEEDTISGMIHIVPGQDPIIEMVSGELFENDQFWFWQCQGTHLYGNSGNEEGVDLSGTFVEPYYYGETEYIYYEYINQSNACVDGLAEPLVFNIYCGEEATGCTDNNACNYNPCADVDDGSCSGTIGCTNPENEEYDPLATCMGPFCTYDIYGLYFFDENENGVFDDLDYGLGGHEINIGLFEGSVFTNEEGVFLLNDFLPGTYQVSPEENEYYPYITTSFLEYLTLDDWGEDIPLLHFGVSNEEPDFDLGVSLFSSSGFPCNDYVHHHICVSNLGNDTVDCVIALNPDELFTDYSEVFEVDSVVDGVYYFSIESLGPTQQLCIEIDLIGPTEDNLGETVSSFVEAWGINEDNIVAGGQDSFESIVTCAYDPNDKLVDPPGYEEEHFINAESELEYTIRFQNTGNDTATDVVIHDILDENLDLNTFEVVAYSHSQFTSLNYETRLLEFHFLDINLPDSLSNEEESHGFVSFRISPLDGIDPNTEITNGAEIYFDENEPIVTNSVWNTIFDCSVELADVVFSDNQVCKKDTVGVFAVGYPIEEYIWYFDGEPIGTNSPFVDVFSDLGGTHTLTLTAINPVCTISMDHNFYVVNLSPPTIEYDEGILTSSSAYQYQWHDSSGPIPGAFEQNYSPLSNGIYAVEITNYEGCSEFSEWMVLSDISMFEMQDQELLVYPNPVMDKLHFSGSTKTFEVIVSDLNGKTIQRQTVNNHENIDMSQMPGGSYIVQFITENEVVYKKIIVEN